MEGKTNQQKSIKENELIIDPIPIALKLYGFLLMIFIFCLVLIFTNMIKIPMSYNAEIIETNKQILSLKLNQFHKAEFLPEANDSIKLLHIISNKEIGIFCVDTVLVKDTLILVESNNIDLENINDFQLKILYQNKTLFNLVFERFYRGFW